MVNGPTPNSFLQRTKVRSGFYSTTWHISIVQIIKESENIKFSQKYSIQFQEVLCQIQELNSGYKCVLVLFHHHTLLEITHFFKCNFLLYFTSQYTKDMGTFES
jgi:hypothetical protein